MRLLLPLAALATLTLAGPATAKRDAVPEARPVGAPVSCIPLSQIRNSRVRSDKVIDFVMKGRNRVYRNQLPYECSSLGFEERFAYKTSINQLCSSDIITVLRSPPTVQGPSCGLGKFVPVELADKAAR